MKNLFLFAFSLLIAGSLCQRVLRSCSNICGMECENACGTNMFKPCCLNYVKKRSSGSSGDVVAPLWPLLDPNIRLELWLSNKAKQFASWDQRTGESNVYRNDDNDKNNLRESPNIN